MKLNDHSQPCAHEFFAVKEAQFGDFWRCGRGSCPGGREIKLKQVGPRMDDGWVIDYVDDEEKTWKMVETDET